MLSYHIVQAIVKFQSEHSYLDVIKIFEKTINVKTFQRA